MKFILTCITIFSLHSLSDDHIGAKDGHATILFQKVSSINDIAKYNFYFCDEADQSNCILNSNTRLNQKSLSVKEFNQIMSERRDLIQNRLNTSATLSIFLIGVTVVSGGAAAPLTLAAATAFSGVYIINEEEASILEKILDNPHEIEDLYFEHNTKHKLNNNEVIELAKIFKEILS